MQYLKMFKLNMLTMLFVILITPKVYALPSVMLELSDPNIEVGNSFDLNVIANGVTDIDPFWGPDGVLAFGFDVVYGLSEFDYNGATVGLGFMDDSGFFANTDVAGSAFPAISGDGILLASLNFTVLTAGVHSLGIFSDMFDMNEGLLTWLSMPLDMTDSINVSVTASSSPVPEPSTLLLLGFGLTGLIAWRKRVHQ